MRSARPIVDQVVAKQIRERRRSLGFTRRLLAERIGVTAQQLHNYEQCENSVSAGLLYEIATALGTSPGYFFNGLEEPASSPLPPRQRLLFDLVRSLREIERKQHRVVLRDLVRALTSHIVTANPTAAHARAADSSQRKQPSRLESCHPRTSAGTA
jgi:transcriptional regulator with XRE-family HTH domain